MSKLRQSLHSFALARVLAKGPREPAGMHKIEPGHAPCSSPKHQPPIMIHVPAGHKYVHYCPECDAKFVLYGRLKTL